MLKGRITFTTLALALSSLALLAQNQVITPTVSDDLAAGDATALFVSADRALTDAGRSARGSELVISAVSRADRHSNGDGRGPSMFPADLSMFSPTGAVVPNATQHNVYINQPPAAWGNPAGFQNDLNHSDLIDITNQYVGVDFDGRYPLGASFGAHVTPGSGFPPAAHNIVTLNQILGLAHAVGSITGTGYTHIVNVFIPPGTDTCFPGNTQCFSPDHPSTFVFCAYHGSVDFTDIGHVLFTVEPETGVPGCASQQPSPNGIVADSVDSTLSHELIELITDPDGDAWIALNSLDLLGFEIGDVCQPGGNDQAEFLVPTFRVNGHPYAIQLEYSNRGHGCFSRPGGGS